MAQTILPPLPPRMVGRYNRMPKEIILRKPLRYRIPDTVKKWGMSSLITKEESDAINVDLSLDIKAKLLKTEKFTPKGENQYGFLLKYVENNMAHTIWMRARANNYSACRKGEYGR